MKYTQFQLNFLEALCSLNGIGGTIAFYRFCIDNKIDLKREILSAKELNKEFDDLLEELK